MQMASPSQILSAQPPVIQEPEIINIGWNNLVKRFHVPLCANNNMPIHIKGDTQWLEKEGVWNYHITDSDGGLWPVAFFNNDWWLLNVENSQTLSHTN